MRQMRTVSEILQTVDLTELSNDINTSNKHREMIKNGSDLDPNEVDKMIDVIQEYNVLQKTCYVLDDAIKAAVEERIKYKYLYEGTKEKEKSNEYLNKWIDLSKEIEAMKSELNYYNGLRAKREDEVITYDKLLDSTLDKILEKEKANDKKEKR